MLCFKNRKINNNGASVLFTVLLMGGIIVDMAFAGVFLMYYLNQSIYGTKLSSEALAAADSGVQDAMLKIIRDKNIDYATSNSPYTLVVGERTAEVSIYRDYETEGKDIVYSVGEAVTKRRKLRAVLSVDKSTGEIRLESLEEVSI